MKLKNIFWQHMKKAATFPVSLFNNDWFGNKLNLVLHQNYLDEKF